MGIQEILSEESAKMIPADYTARARDVGERSAKVKRTVQSAQAELAGIDARLEAKHRDAMRNTTLAKLSKAVDPEIAEIHAGLAWMTEQYEGWLSRDAHLRAAKFDKDAARDSSIRSDWRGRLASASPSALEAHARDAARTHDRALAQVLYEEVARRDDDLSREEKLAVKKLLGAIVVSEADVAAKLFLEADQALDDARQDDRLVRDQAPNGEHYHYIRGQREADAKKTGAALAEALDKKWFPRRRSAAQAEGSASSAPVAEWFERRREQREGATS